MKSSIFLKVFIVLFAFSIFISCRPKNKETSVVRSPEFKQSIDEVYERLRLFRETNFVPGMSVAVSVDNKLVFADGFGYSNLEFKVPAMPDHRYRIGTVSEIITTLTAAKLYELNKLGIDKPTSELLNENGTDSLKYTIRQLAGHAAGIEEETDPAGTKDPDEIGKMVSTFINHKLMYEPGTFSFHTELDFDMIGYLIQKTQNQPFDKVVKEILSDSLKLQSTMPDNPFRVTDKKTSHYEMSYLSQPIMAEQIDLRGKEASAGYISSVTDLVKIGNLFLFPGFLKQETIDMMTRPFQLKNGGKSRYGFGLIVVNDSDGRLLYGAHGNVLGGCAALLIDPTDKIVVAMAANMSGKGIELPVSDVSRAFIRQLHSGKN